MCKDACASEQTTFPKVAAKAVLTVGPAWLTRETHPFLDFEHVKSENEKNLGFFSFFRFDVLKIDRGAHLAWLTRETHPFPDFEHVKSEK